MITLNKGKTKIPIKINAFDSLIQEDDGPVKILMEIEINVKNLEKIYSLGE